MEIPACCKIGSKVCTPSPKRNRKKSADQKKITKAMKSNNDLAKKIERDMDERKKDHSAASAPKNDLLFIVGLLLLLRDFNSPLYVP